LESLKFSELFTTYVDDSPLKSTTSLPVGVPTPTNDDHISHGNVVSGLVEKFQASVEVTAGISKVRSVSDPPLISSQVLKRKKQVSRSQIPSTNKHQHETSLEDDAQNRTEFKYVFIYTLTLLVSA